MTDISVCHIYAYQSVLLADLAVMRGLTPGLNVLNPQNQANRIIVASPSQHAGLHDPERRLTLGDVLQAIREGIERCHIDHGGQATVTPDEIATVFLELLREGYLVIYPSKEKSLPLFNDIIERTIDTIVEKAKDIFDNRRDLSRFEFKSIHGELARQAANASPLPSRYEAVGFLALPAVLEPLPSESDFQGLPREAKDWLRSQCSDKGDILLSALEDALKKSGYEKLNTYQCQVISEYFRHRFNSNKPLNVILTAPTGAGKTLAFIVIVLLEILAAKCKNSRIQVVLTYPRKTLARDQVEDLARILAFLNDILLKKRFSSIILWLRDGSSGVSKCPSNVVDCVELPRQWGSIRGITIPIQSGGQSYIYARHYYDDSLDAYISEPYWLVDVKDDVKVKIDKSIYTPGEIADIIVTNYDMLFKESIDILRGSPTQLGNVLINAEIVVLDEAHIVMGGRQSVMIQTYVLALRKANRNPGIILSSATLLERRLIQQNVSLQNVVALEIREGPSRDDALKAFKGILGIGSSDNIDDNTLYIDYYKIASKRPGKWKLTLWTIIYPSILKKPITALNEAIVSIAHTLAAFRAKLNNEMLAKAIVFIEYKRSLYDIASELVSRIILESGDVYDRILLPKLFDKHIAILDQWIQANTSNPSSLPQIVQGGARKAHKEITSRIRKLVSKYPQISISDIIWNNNFIRFHALAPYLTLDDYMSILNCRANATSRPEEIIENIIKCVVCRANKVFPSPPLNNDVWMEHMLIHAALMLKHSSWRSGSGLDRYYQEVEEISKKIGIKIHEFIPLVFHHGDYTGPHRHLADRLLQEAKPLIILATSTLDVGLNILGVTVTMYYILPREPGKILQEVGRGGREAKSMRVSHGIAVLRQNAWEASKRVELHAFRYFNEITLPPTVNLANDPYNLSRLCITIGLQDCDSFQGLVDQVTLNKANDIINNRKHIISNMHRASRTRSPKCSQALMAMLTKYTQYTGTSRSIYRDVFKALKALNTACSSGNNNHVIILAAAENAYATILDVIMRGNIPKTMEKILKSILTEILTLRSNIYSHILDNVKRALDNTSNKRGYNLNDIIESLVYPRGFEVPGAGDKKSLAGNVIIVR